MSSESDREDCGAGGAGTVSCFSTVCRALLPWAAAAAMLFGGELAAQEDPQPLTPDDPKCAVDGTTVTCTGDLSPGVLVPGDALGTYTTLYVNKLDGNIAPAEGDEGIVFTGDGNITLDVDTGDYDITTSGTGALGIKVEGSGGNIDVDVKGDITTKGASSNGVSVSGSGGTTDVDVNGDITTNGASSNGVYVSGGGGKTTVEVNGNIETLGTTGSGGLYVSNNDSDIKITLTGDITVRSGDGLTGFASNAGNIEIIVQGDITNWDSAGSGINTGSERGDVAITLEGGTVTSSGRTGIWFSNLAGNTVQNTLRVTADRTVTIRGGLRDVEGQDNNETINNFGTLTTPGIVDLAFVDPDDDEGTNIFNNMVDATYNSGTSIILGDDAEDLFSNAGNLSPGGANVVQITQLTGDFENFITDENDTVNAGIFTVTIDPNDPALFDQFVVNGKITLNGGTVRVVGAYDNRRYTILKSETQSIKDYDPNLSTTEAIAKVDAIDTLFMDYEVEQGDNTFEMVLVSARKFDSFCEVAGTANQRAGACNALDGLPEANPIVQAFRALPENGIAQARAGFDLLSGEVHGSLKGALMMDTVQRPVAAVNRRLNARLGYPDARRSTATIGDLSSRADSESGLWMTGYGASGETEATANTAQMDMNLSGGLLGIDRALGKHWRLGVLGGYSQTDVTQQARVSSGLAETWSVGLYSGAKADALRLRLGALYNRHAITASRTVGFPGYSPERLSARYNAQSWQFFAETGYRMQSRYLMLEPFAGVSYTGFSTDGFSETGGAAALTASAETDKMTFSTLGMRSAVQMIDAIHATGMAGWRHAFDDTDPSSTFTMAGSPIPFTGWGAPIAEDAVVTELGLEANLLGDAIFGVAYNGRYGDGVTAHGFNASLKVAF